MDKLVMIQDMDCWQQIGIAYDRTKLVVLELAARNATWIFIAPTCTCLLFRHQAVDKGSPDNL